MNKFIFIPVFLALFAVSSIVSAQTVQQDTTPQENPMLGPSDFSTESDTQAQQGIEPSTSPASIDVDTAPVQQFNPPSPIAPEQEFQQQGPVAPEVPRTAPPGTPQESPGFPSE